MEFLGEIGKQARARYAQPHCESSTGAFSARCLQRLMYWARPTPGPDTIIEATTGARRQLTKKHVSA